MLEGNRITRIEPAGKSRYKIFIEDEFRFILYKKELSIFHMEEGKEISEAAIRKILTEILPERAKLRSMNLVKNRNYTEYQLREKLKQGFYPETAIEEAVAYMKAHHYINDRRYAKDYIVYYSESRSRGRIMQDLLRKGISREVIQDVCERDLEEEKIPEEKQLIEKLLEKKHYRKETADYEMKQKMAAFLYRKGFSADSIGAAL